VTKDAGGPKASRPGWIERRARKAADIVYYTGLRLLAAILGFKPRHQALDRRILDEQILPRLARNDRFARVLFVGCDWYTEHVEEIFVARGRTYTTIEIDPGRARHGASRHIVGALGDLGRYAEPGSLDLIVCNGVIGWGLNQPEDIERALAACAEALSPGGVLLLGWDDVPEKLPLPIESIQALRSLTPTAPAEFDAPRIATFSYTRHTFGFWARPLR
jgi:SAM-dependent methyltransferase